VEINLQKLINIIKVGSPADVKIAQKQIEKIWRDTCQHDDNKREEIFYIFLEELKIFSQIKDINHQAYFINTLKWPLHFIGEKYFSDWSDFILAYIQHPSGKIRQAIIKISDYLIMDLRMDFKYDFVRTKDKNLNRQEIIVSNKKKFCSFVFSIEDLTRQYYESIFKKYKYVDSLPIGVYKSLQMLLANLLEAEFYEKMYHNFLNELAANKQPTVSYNEIMKMRQQIEEQLEQVIKKTDTELKIDDIKNIVYNESGQKDLQKIISSFSSIQDFNELQQLVALIMDAWNYWPHKNLEGLAPVEKN